MGAPSNNGVTTNGNGSATPEGKQSSLLSDHSGGDRGDLGPRGDRGDMQGMHHHHHHHRSPAISKTNLYIRGLTPNTTDKDLHSLCSPYVFSFVDDLLFF